jgi:hypothetical protein
MKKLMIMMFTVVFLAAAPAWAAPIPLGSLTPGFYDQQDSPCFIGYSCGPNQGVSYTTYSALDQGTDFSPVYTGAQLALLKTEVGLNPLIAIDINQVKSNENTIQYLIDYIKVYINGSLAYQFGVNTVPVPQLETGNGVSDYVISGLDLTGATTSLQFEVQYGSFAHTDKTIDIGDNNDGKELFFLVKAGSTQVPEPLSLLLLGLGLAGLAGVGRFRK